MFRLLTATCTAALFADYAFAPVSARGQAAGDRTTHIITELESELAATGKK